MTTKTSGLGHALYVAGYDLSADTQSAKFSSPQGTFDFTGIDVKAYVRGGARRDGKLSIVSFYDTAPAQSHAVYSPLPRTDELITYGCGAAIGAPAYCLNAKMIDYAGTRAAGGEYTFAVDAQANNYGSEWGLQLTAGKRTDAAATNGTSLDGGASSAFGAQGYLQVFAFTGTDVTVTLQDSADNATFANVASGSFAQVTSSTPSTQRIALSNTATVRRYVRAITTTSGGFTNLVFNVVLNRNPVAGVSF